MKMNRVIFALNCSLLALCIGCGIKAATPPTAPTIIDPGYYSVQDENFAKALAPLRAFINEEIVNQYPKLSPAQQAQVKGPLNAMQISVNAADVIYLAYHQGQAPGGAAPLTPTPSAAHVADAIAVAQEQQGRLKAALVTATPQ